jgi:predicted Zn-dependent protease
MPHSAAGLLLKLVALSLCALLAAGCATQEQLEQQAEGQFSQMQQTIPQSKSGFHREYVQCVARAVIAALDEPYASDDWQIVLFENDEYNAFAMPGGKIGVFSGILTIASTQDQLAAIIGHEIAHVIDGHAMERMDRAMPRKVLTTGAVVYDIFTGSNTQAVVEQAGPLYALAIELPFSRSQESEADLLGVRYMAAAGFDPYASIRLWANMAAANQSTQPEYFSTHPSAATRMAQLSAEMPAVVPIYERAAHPQCGP